MENLSFFYTIYKHTPQNVSLVNMFPVVRLLIFNIQTSLKISVFQENDFRSCLFKKNSR